MVDERDNYVYIAEADLEAVARAIRRLRLLLLAPIPVILASISLVAIIAWLDGHPPLLSDFLPRLLIIPVLLVAAAYFVVPRWIKKTNVMIGGDFINAPLTASPRFTATVKYKDMTRVRVHVSKGCIVGATIVANGVAVDTGRIKDPGIVVRAILERGPECVKWRRSGWPPRRLSREEVQEWLDEAQVPGVNDLLPPLKEYARAEDLFSREQPEESLPGIKGWLQRLFGGGTCRSMTVIGPEIPTPASRYVNFMLLQMFQKGETTRILKQAERLPTLTLESGTAEPPPLQEVLNRLKTLCRLDAKSDRALADGTIDVKINGMPCKVLCRFDKDADACCQMRLERVAQ